VRPRVLPPDHRGDARDAAASPGASLLIAVIQLIFWHDAGDGTTLQDQMETALSMIASKTTLNLKDVKSCFKALRVIAREEVRTTSKFIIPGLVTLTVKEKPAQRCRHPDWGIDTPTKKVIKVAPKKYLKDSVAAVPWHQTEEWLDEHCGGQMI